MSDPPLRVVIVDDHPVFRRGLRAVINASPALELVGEAADGAEAVTVAAASLPDVVLMDLAMPVMDGIEATRRIVGSDAGPAVLVLTMADDEEAVLAAMRAGARGYLVKGADHDEIERSIHAVAAGELLVGAEVAAHVLGLLLVSRPVPRSFPELTHREHEVLALLADGQSNAAIAQRLQISSKTVRNHVSNVLSKLGVTDRAAAGAAARERR